MVSALFHLSMFAGIHDNAPKGKNYTWTDIISGFSRVVETESKDTRGKDIRLFCPAVFREGGRRSKADVDCVTMLVFDMDGGHDPTDFMERWKARGLSFMFYTSFSHTEDHPKWRVMFPFKEPVKGANWEKAWRLMNQDLAQGLSDPACKDPCHMYFMPCSRYGQKEYHGACHFEGESLDASPYVNAIEPETAREAHESRPGTPGTWLNENVSIEDILRPHGWEFVGGTGLQAWRRPGKKDSGISATWGYRPDYGGERFYCFSSSTELPENRILTKFGVYAILNFNSDFSEAAKSIAREYNLPPKLEVIENESPIPAPTPNTKPTSEVMEGTWLNTADQSDALQFGICGRYIPRREITLYEGPEGEGKTTGVCGFAAHGSVGKSPITGEEFEPFKSLILTTEQRAGQMAKRIQQMHGDISMVKIVTKDFVLNDVGLVQLEKEIDKNGFRLVVLDPIWEYKPPQVNENSRPSVQVWMTKIQRVADRTDCGILAVNHFAKFMRGKDIRDLGINNSGLRSRCRSHLCLFTDPDNANYKTIIHCKANFEGKVSPAFGFEWSRMDLVEWISAGNADTSFIDAILKAKKK